MRIKKIAEHLKTARENANITLEELSIETGLDLELVTSYEEGKKLINYENGLIVSRVLNMDPYNIGFIVPSDIVLPRSIFAPLKFSSRFTPIRFLINYFKPFFGAFRKQKKGVNSSIIENQLFSLEENTHYPFIFLRISLLLLGVAGLAYWADSIVIANLSLSMVIPVGLMWFIFEAHHPRLLKGFEIIKFFLYGGLIAIIVVFFIRGFSGYINVPFLGDFITGLVEEIAKVLTVLFLARKRMMKNMLEGVLIGFAVGAGFSVFETTAYGMNELLSSLDFTNMLWLISVRSFFGLIGAGHHFWTAILAGVVVMMSRTGHLRVADLWNPVFMFWYIIMALFHGLWNFNQSLPMAFVIAICSLLLFILIWSKASMDYKLSIPEPNIEVEPEIVLETPTETQEEVVVEKPIETQEEALVEDSVEDKSKDESEESKEEPSNTSTD